MKIRIIFILLTISLSLASFAQKSRVSGKVTNQKNEALVGVSIEISGAVSGMLRSDVEGRFSFPAEFSRYFRVLRATSRHDRRSAYRS